MHFCACILGTSPLFQKFVVQIRATVLMFRLRLGLELGLGLGLGSALGLVGMVDLWNRNSGPSE